MASIYEKSFEDIAKTVCHTTFIDWDSFRNKTILITGGTGLIGYSFIRSVIYTSNRKGLNIRLIALVRDKERAKVRFDFDYSDQDLVLIEGVVENPPDIKEDIDYVVHGASKTASMEFIGKPVETIETAVIGTINILKLAKRKMINGFVYLSSMEVYGYPKKGHKVTENDIGSLTPRDLRNCYPISKVQCECLCKSYASEYGLPITVARLTQTIGPFANYDDTRIFAYLGKCVAEKKDIILKTRGETERSYLHTSDAVTAILKLLLDGQSGQIYNVADEDTYCSIAEMATRIADKNGLKVIIECQGSPAQNGYPNTLYMDLDTSLLRQLGWRAQSNFDF